MDNEFAALKPVDSSMFSRAGYDETNWRLLFEFKSTHEIRSYKNVSPEIADEALSAESLGKFFNSQIKGNSLWEFDTLGADPSQPPPEPKATKATKAKPQPELEGGLTEEDLNMIAPAPKTVGTVVTQVQSNFGPEDVFDGPVTVSAPKMMHVSEVGHWPQSEGEAFETAGSALTKQTEGEILGAWTAPGSAAEALDLMAERDGEIKAIIAASKSTGEQALTVRVTDEASHNAASETLKALVAKKDTTTALLEPFRAVLYAVYEEAAGFKKAALTPLEAGEKHIKGQIVTWKNEQERIRQQKIREENERREQEARRLQEEEAARIKLADVQDAIDDGDHERAQTLFDQPATAPRPYVAPAYIPPVVEKFEGQSTSTTWKVDRDLVESDETGAAYIASITKFLAAVKNGTYAIEQAAPLLSWGFAACDKLAGALMGAFNIPGLQAGPATTLRVSRGRKKK